MHYNVVIRLLSTDLIFNDTLLMLTLVETAEDIVLPLSTSSSEKALDIPESVDTESTAKGPENCFDFFASDMAGWTLGGVLEELRQKR